MDVISAKNICSLLPELDSKALVALRDGFVNEEKEYATRYLNTDVNAEKTYEDENVEMYIVDKRG